MNRENFHDKDQEDHLTKIELQFSDDMGCYSKDFLRENFPYFKALFESGMSDACKNEYSLPMKRSVFDVFRQNGEAFLQDLAGINDGSEGFPGSIRDAILFLQIDHKLVSYPSGQLCQLKEKIESSWFHAGGDLEVFPVSLARDFVKLRYFHDEIMKIGTEEKEKNEWRKTKIPDIIPIVPKKYTQMQYIPNCKFIAFFQKEMLDNCEVESILFDDDIVYCFALEKETDFKIAEYEIQERRISDFLGDEDKNSQLMLEGISPSFPLVSVKSKETNSFTVTVKSPFSQKKIFIQNGFRRKGPWRRLFDFSFDIFFS
ncbi:Oidioi.mRNA.OKI2018_I69.chrUn_2.g17228.t1.cds [Oikopleura dioica]|uniref:Oidioi.mRNA.OKI2018_I69.chrUn_2.g17228.t1.c ds n=1 Tax=Oikopleura dioica TaxID=34765 RepID=A0ABN7TFK1_OIKDI|nr:Oidioi.mRNA.OKI2018_I69.chrUn_2.g17228.t1.cds [Oikopleura dioica]